MSDEQTTSDTPTTKTATPVSTIIDPEGFTADVKTGKRCCSQRNIDLAIKKLTIDLYFDTLKHRLMMGFGDTVVTVEDKHVDSLWLLIEERFHFRPARDYFRVVIENRGLGRETHPVREYLDALTWDGVPRIDTWLIDYAGAEDNAFVRAVSRIVLVAAVRRARTPGCKFDEMLVLLGAQGTDKSQALRALAVEDSWFGDCLAFGTTDQRKIEAIEGKWIVEAGELKGMSAATDHEVKQWLSRQEDEQRMAYARLKEYRPRQFVVIGTTNDVEFLKDKTGNRRYWPVAIKRFRLDALREVVDQLWAEACQAEAGGESIRLAEELWAVAEIEQERVRVKDPTEILLRDALTGVEGGRILLSSVWELAGVDLSHRSKPSNAESREISVVMNRLGWIEVDKIDVGGKLGRAWVKGEGEIRKRVLVVVSGKVVRK